MSRPTLPRDVADFVAEWAPALREFASRFVFDTFTWDPPNVPASTVSDVTLTSTSYPELVGLRPGMAIIITPPSDLDSGLQVDTAWCATADQLTIRLRNGTGGGIDQGEGDWSFMGVRS